MFNTVKIAFVVLIVSIIGPKLIDIYQLFSYQQEEKILTQELIKCEKEDHFDSGNLCYPQSEELNQFFARRNGDEVFKKISSR